MSDVPPPTDAPSILERLGSLNRGRHRNTREEMPNKPLLVLWALQRIQAGHPDRMASFGRDIKDSLKSLIKDFSNSKNNEPRLPFWHLRNNGIWDITNIDVLKKRYSGKCPSQKTLEPQKGGFPVVMYELLCGDRVLLEVAVQTVLDFYFVVPQHQSIRDEVGLLSRGAHELVADDDVPSSLVIPDRVFQREVVNAYEERCAICEYDLQIEGIPLGLVATHIQSNEAGGPSEVPNGLALCGSHSAALNRGAIGLEPRGEDFVVLVSNQLKGKGMAYEMLLLFEGRPLRPPRERDQVPSLDFVTWHRRQVFRGHHFDKSPHQGHGLTACPPPSRVGGLRRENGLVSCFP